MLLWTLAMPELELLKLVGRFEALMMSAGMWYNQTCINYGFGFKVGML